MMRRINENGQLSSFDLGTDFTLARQEKLDYNVNFPVQFSVIKKGGKFDNGSFISVGKVGESN
jgi:hypothetical protein